MSDLTVFCRTVVRTNSSAYKGRTCHPLRQGADRIGCNAIVCKVKEGILARDNYSYKKYQKELARKKKAEEKMQRRLAKKNPEAKADLSLPGSQDAAPSAEATGEDSIS